jgi:DNA-binding transcriptional MocR family regulator
MSAAGHIAQSVEREREPELSVQSCLEGVGISLLSEWDVLAFVYRHGASLTSVEQIARLIGYESTVVAAAIDRLECEKLIERSRPSRGVQFYRVPASMDTRHRPCFQQLLSLSAGPAGRRMLAERLKPAP